MTTPSTLHSSNEDFDNLLLEITQETQTLERICHDDEGNVKLPRHTRSYYDSLSSEYKKVSMERKLLELAYVLSKDFNLVSSIENYKIDRPEYIVEEIPRTIIQFISYMRFSEYISGINVYLEEELDEAQLIKLFIEELALRYDTVMNKVILNGYTEEELILAANEDKDTFYRLMLTSEMTKRVFENN